MIDSVDGKPVLFQGVSPKLLPILIRMQQSPGYRPGPKGCPGCDAFGCCMRHDIQPDAPITPHTPVNY